MVPEKSRGTALVVGDVSRMREAVRAALVADGWQVLLAPAIAADAGAASEEGLAAGARDALRAGPGPRRIVIVSGEAGDQSLSALEPARFRALESSMLVAPWLALRDATAQLHEAADAVLVVADVAGRAGQRGAFAITAQRALRTMVAAAAVEFAARPKPLRVNLLEYDATYLDPVAFARAVAFLASPAAGFMTGTPLSLPSMAQGAA